MVRPHVKNLDAPDETVPFPHGSAANVAVGELVIGRVVTEPGWRWSEHIRPIAGTRSCQFHHVGIVLSGRGHIEMDDGTSLELGPNDVFDIPPGHDAWTVGDEPEVSLVWSGWRGWAKPAAGDQVVSTLLFTDIVDSTGTAERLGRAAWDRLLQAHNDSIRLMLDRYRGVEVTSTGDGFLAMFDGAARAVRCAAAIRDEIRALELKLRISVHTGEIEVVPGNIRGVTVHEAARMLAIAEPGEILVSAVTKAMLAGSDLAFVDRGLHALRGLTGERQLFALA